LQGNGYDQNLGDRMGALASLGKALVLAKPLVAAHPEDKDALRALATVEQSRSEILYQEGQTVESVAALREAIAHFDVVIADPHTSAPLLGEAASAYGSLGDQLGAPGTPSLGDRPGAILWYKKTIDLDHRALQMDPHFLRAQRGLAIMQMKLGQVEVFSDPALAIEDYRAAMRQTDALPASQQSTLYILRLRANLLRKQANALSEMEEFAAAKPLYDQVVRSQEKLADDDPQDARAQFDLAIDLSDQADSEKNAVDLKLRAGPALKRLASPGPAEVETLRSAVGQLQQAAEILDQIRPQDPANTSWLAELGKVLVQLGSIQAMIPGEQVSEARTERGLTMLRDLAKVEGAPPSLLDQAADAFLEAEPARLRDAKFALDCAQREAKE
jgi:tetratricopeptide (TPR) repeat protein